MVPGIGIKNVTYMDEIRSVYELKFSFSGLVLKQTVNEMKQPKNNV